MIHVGKVFTLAELEGIADIVRRHPHVTVVSDEVYKYTVYHPLEAGDPTSQGHYHFARLPGMWDRTVTISSCGKTFSVTGWQVGWVLAAERYIAPSEFSLPTDCIELISFSYCLPNSFCRLFQSMSCYHAFSSVQLVLYRRLCVRHWWLPKGRMKALTGRTIKTFLYLLVLFLINGMVIAITNIFEHSSPINVQWSKKPWLEWALKPSLRMEVSFSWASYLRYRWKVWRGISPERRWVRSPMTGPICACSARSTASSASLLRLSSATFT